MLDQLNAIIGLVIGLLTICVILGGWLVWLHSRFAKHEQRLVLLESNNASNDLKKDVGELRDELEWVARLLLIIADREGVDISKIKRRRGGSHD